MSHHTRAQYINKSVAQFNRYAFKVSQIIDRTHPHVKFQSRTLFYVFGLRYNPSTAAKYIIREWELNKNLKQ